MTKQEIFDIVAKHLLTQNCKALGLDGRCSYRGDAGTKCAVGILISDEEYYPEMEGFNVTGLKLPDRLLPHIDFLTRFQIIHDGCNVEDWEALLLNTAKKYHLSAETLRKF